MSQKKRITIDTDEVRDILHDMIRKLFILEDEKDKAVRNSIISGLTMKDDGDIQRLEKLLDIH